MTHLLFSYGTLQLEKVQLASFGRKLKGHKAVLKGYKVGQLQITDPAVLELSNQQFHPVALKTGNADDQIEGMLFEVSAAELEMADKYEVSDYMRIQETFDSGHVGWIYIGQLSA